MATKTEIKGALITLAKVWGIKDHSIESEGNSFILIDKSSGTVAKEYLVRDEVTHEAIYEAIDDEIHSIVWTDKEDYNPLTDAIRAA